MSELVQALQNLDQYIAEVQSNDKWCFIHRYEHIINHIQGLAAQCQQNPSAIDPFIEPAHRERFLNEITAAVMEWGHYQAANIEEQVKKEFISLSDSPVIKINNGEVRFAFSQDNSDIIYAVKTSDLNSANQLENPNNEAWFYFLLNKDRHPHVLGYIKTFISHIRLVLITPKALGTDLFKYITLKSEASRHRAIIIMYRSCLALDYIHNHLCMAHLDIKPENIFLDEGEMPLWADFGMAHFGRFPYHTHNLRFGSIWTQANKTSSQLKNLMDTCYLEETPASSLPPFSVRGADLLGLMQLANQRRDEILTYWSSRRSAKPSPHPPSVADYAFPYSDPADVERAFDVKSAFINVTWTDASGATQSYPIEHFTGVPLANTTSAQFHAYFDRMQDCAVQYPEAQFHSRHGLSAELFSVLSPDNSVLAQSGVSRLYGTRAYMAPEVMVKDPSYDPFKADIYSLGVVFFILLCGFPPYTRPSPPDEAYTRLTNIVNAAQRRQKQIAAGVSEDSLPPARSMIAELLVAYGKDGVLPIELTNLLSAMMHWNPFERVTIKNVISFLHLILIKMAKSPKL